MKAEDKGWIFIVLFSAPWVIFGASLTVAAAVLIHPLAGVVVVVALGAIGAPDLEMGCLVAVATVLTVLIVLWFPSGFAEALVAIPGGFVGMLLPMRDSVTTLIEKLIPALRERDDSDQAPAAKGTDGGRE